MSIYSGFATRNQQKHYDKVLYNVISTLMVRIVKFYKSQTIDEKAFRKLVRQQQKTLSKLEKHKYMDPKYAQLLEHFMKRLEKQQTENRQEIDQHLDFEMRRRSIEESYVHDEGLNRTLSVLGNEMQQLNRHFVEKEREKIDTLQMLDDINSDKDLLLSRIPQKRHNKQHTSHKKKNSNKKPRSNSMKSNIDIWDLRRQKLPEIPNLQPVQQNILSRTRCHTKIDFSDKLTNKTMDDNIVGEKRGEASLKKGLENPPKFRAKVFFK